MKTTNDREIPTIMRSLGLNPTPEQAEAVIQEMKAGSETALIQLDQFEPVIVKVCVNLLFFVNFTFLVEFFLLT